MYLLECCVDSVESAREAQRGGANRLELCANLIIGGTTPGLALFEAVRRHTSLAVNVLLRPRFGDFCYTDFELDQLCAEVELFRGAGADGVVIGVLTPDGALDLPRMRRLISLAGDMHLTLHRAFDVCRDPFAALKQARELGMHTILTSGQKNSAPAGAALLQQLTAQSGGVTIMPGGGITSGNIAYLAEQTGAHAFHLSAKHTLESAMQFRNPDVSMGLPLMSEYEIFRTDGDEIARARAALDHLPEYYHPDEAKGDDLP